MKHLKNFKEINEGADYDDIFRYMRKLFNQGIDDDAILVERTAMELGIDMEEYEDDLWDAAAEVTGGNF